MPAGFGHIFQKWINVTTKPGAQSFATELPTANWGDVWIGLILLAVVSAIVGFIGRTAASAALASYTATLPADQQARMNQFVGAVAGPGAAIGSIITVPLAFFIWSGILFLFAKMFGGSGTFLQQSYARSLYYVPIGVVSSIVGLVPILGSLVAFALLIYDIVLNVFSIMASQRLSGGKATAVVLLPIAILLLLLCGLIVLAVTLILNAAHGLTS